MLHSSAAYDHREVSKARAWVKRQMAAGRSVASEDNGSDVFVLFSFTCTLAEAQEEYERGLTESEAYRLVLVSSSSDLK